MKKKRIAFSSYEPTQAKRLLPLFLIIFIDSLAYFLVIPVLLRLFINGHFHLLPASTSLAMRDLIYGVTITLSPLAFLIAAPLVGNLSDRFGRKSVMFYCLIGSLLGFILPIIGILRNSLWLILIGRFVGGAGTGSQPIAQAAVTDFTEGKTKAFYLSIIGFAMTLAMILGPLGGGYLSDSSLVRWFNVSTPYWFGAILAIANLFLLLLFFKDETQVIAKTKPLEPLSTRLKELCGILSPKAILILLALFFIMEFAWSQYYQSIFLYLTQKFHYSADKVGLFTGYIGLWMSLGLTVIYKYLTKRFSLAKILSVSLIVIGVGLIFCNNFYSPLAQWVFIVPVAICFGTFYPSVLTLLSNRAPEDHQGWVLGTASLLLGLSWMITGFLSGMLISINEQLPILVATFAAIAGAILFFTTKQKNHDTVNNASATPSE